MSSVNQATLVGNVGRDPEIRETRDGRRVATFSVATSESWRDKATGEKRERTEWHNVVVWSEGLVKVAEQYLRKGMKLYVQGQICTRKWTDSNQVDRWSTEIVLSTFDAKIVMLSSSGGGRPPGPDSADDYGSGPAAARDPLDDEIPF